MDRLLSPRAFQHHLAAVVAPIVNRYSDETPGKIEEIASVLYDLSLDLFACGCFGGQRRYPLVSAAWERLLPRLGPVLAASPRRVAAGISNALFHLTAQKGAGEGVWLKTMQNLAPVCRDPDTFLRAGQVAAWKAGMAQYRQTALTVCKSLPARLVNLIFERPNGANTEADKERLIEKLSRNPWYDPTWNRGNGPADLEVVRRVGGFSGFDGLFNTPPNVKSAGGRIFLYDDVHHWVLQADAFGVSLHRAGSGPPDGRTARVGGFRIDRNGKVHYRGAVFHFPQLRGWSSAVSVRHTLVVCLPCSHYAYVLAERIGDAHGAG